MPIEIRQPVSADEFTQYFHLRWKILRAPWHQPEGSEVDALESSCFHLMAIDNSSTEKNKIVAVARLQFNTDKQAQIRYMAVAREDERKGIGRALVNALEQHAINSSCNTIVLDARQAAVGFYEKLGYRVIKKSYLLFNAIQHFQMKKTLT